MPVLVSVLHCMQLLSSKPRPDTSSPDSSYMTNHAGTVQVLKSQHTGEVESCETKNGNDVIKTVSGDPQNEEVYHYATAGVVGNGSFGVVFQATCLETSETVRSDATAAQASLTHNGACVRGAHAAARAMM